MRQPKKTHDKTTRISRRQFLINAAALAAAGKTIPLARADWSPQSSGDLAELYNTAGFDPLSPNSAVIVQLSDVHINPDTLNTPTIDDRIVNAINGLSPLPNELVVSGDLAQSHPRATGSPRNVDDYELARLELRTGMEELARFDSSMRRWVIPGNHDTDVFEEDPELWMEETGLPPYQVFTCAGVPVFLLNGRHSGDFDQRQREWLRTQFASVPSSQEIIVFVHQPSLLRIGIERGIKRDLVDLLAGRSGTVWVFSGHLHRFQEQSFTERGTLFVQTDVTTANPNAFNDGRNPGFSLICLSAGKVACRITKDVKASQFNLLASPNPQSASPFIWPYSQVPYPILALEEGDFAREDYEVYRKSWDTGTWLSYVGELIYRLPLSAYGGKATEILVLGGVGQRTKVVCGFSATGEEGTWEETTLPTKVADVFRIAIPEHLQGEPSLLFRLQTTQDRFIVDFVVGGWGLGSEGSRLNAIEKWMSQHFKEIRNRGQAAMDACPANDGVPNLWKYAFGLNPLTADARTFDPTQSPALGGLPILWKETLNGSSRLGLRFSRRSAASQPGVRYVLEESENLTVWQEAPSVQETVFGVNGGWEDIALHAPIEGSGKRFHKISVRLTATLLG